MLVVIDGTEHVLEDPAACDQSPKFVICAIAAIRVALTDGDDTAAIEAAISLRVVGEGQCRTVVRFCAAFLQNKPT
jgi:hypothetical protein